MSGDDQYGLRDEDLTLLCGSYCSGVQPNFCEDSDGCRVTAGPIPYLGFAIMEIVILSFFVGMWVLIVTLNPRALTPFMIAFFVITAIGATVGPVVMHGLRIRDLSDNSPLLRYVARTHTISMLNGKMEFPAEQVYCLLFIALPCSHESWGAEVQLVVDSPEGRTRHLIDSALSSTTSVFRKEYLPFAERAGLRLLDAKRTSKLLGLRQGHLTVAEVMTKSQVPQFNP